MIPNKMAVDLNMFGLLIKEIVVTKERVRHPYLVIVNITKEICWYIN
jgi:hypothetical protein